MLHINTYKQQQKTSNKYGHIKYKKEIVNH